MYYPIDSFKNIIECYFKKYVFIEFMPLELYSQGVAPAGPDWYNTNWFKTNFEERFEF